LSDRFTYCNHCSEYYPEDEAMYIEYYDYGVCDDCLEMYYIQCDECGEYFLRSEMHHDDLTQQNYCEDCYDSFEEVAE
jgi:formylmethanofuran dehydrogenase subunit E